MTDPTLSVLARWFSQLVAGNGDVPTLGLRSLGEIDARRDADLPAINSRLRDVAASASDYYLELDASYRVTDIKPIAALARTPDHAAAVRRAIEQRRSVSLEIQSEGQPGRWLDLHVHPSSDGATVLFRDITRRKHAEQEVARSKGLLQATLNALSAPIAIMDEAGLIVAVNNAWATSATPRALSGASVGSNYLSFCAQAARDCREAYGICRGLRSVLAGEKNAARFAYSTEADGRPCWFQLNATRLEREGDSRIVVAIEDQTDVKEAKEALRDLSGRLGALQEEEHQRIAQELHDSTAQHLVAATLNLMTLRAKSTSHLGIDKLLEDIETSLEEATRELRAFTYLLHPPGLENDGLEATLRTYVDGFARRTRLETRLSILGDVESLPVTLQYSLLRVIQEALANVHRHASASRVSISFRMTPEVLKLAIADDGQGIQGITEWRRKGRTQTGLGIPGMKARLRQFDGSLEIDTGSHGTTISATIPLGAIKRGAPTGHEWGRSVAVALGQDRIRWNR